MKLSWKDRLAILPNTNPLIANVISHGMFLVVVAGLFALRSAFQLNISPGMILLVAILCRLSWFGPMCKWVKNAEEKERLLRSEHKD